MYKGDWEYADSRLRDSIVRINDTGEPFFVERVDGEGNSRGVIVRPPGGKEDKTEMVHVEELDLEPVPLGFCNIQNHTVYTQRIPRRRGYRQGLRMDCLNRTSVTRRLNPNMNQLSQVIQGQYPSFKEVFKRALEWNKRGTKTSSRAWHRHWALDSDFNIHYKNFGIVGTAEKDRPVLNEEYIYLTEALEESL